MGLSQQMETVDFTVKQLLPEKTVPAFSELFSGLLTGSLSWEELLRDCFRNVMTYFFGGLPGMQRIFFYSLVLSLFTLLSGRKKQGAAAEAGFFLTYLLTAAELVRLYQDSVLTVQESLDALVEFMQVFLPLYCTGITAAAGVGSASAFYGVAFLGITLVGGLFKTVVLPLVGLYFLCSVFNRLFQEDLLSKLAGLFLAAARITMRVGIGAILGIGSIRGLLSPATDRVRRSGIVRIAGALPVVGDLFDSATQTVLATGGLVKNAIGMAGAVFLFLICLFPALRLGIACAMLQMIAALLQPVSDQRLGDCLGAAARAQKMLFRILMYTMFLFLLLVLLFAAFTGMGGTL